MLKEIYTGSLGMIPQQMKLEVTANNIANANTPGFKREGVFERSLIEARGNLLNVKGSPEEEDLPMGRYYDFSHGSFEKTDNPFDAVINGEGFFLLRDNDGNEFLTRSGHFTLSSDGYLVSPDGKQVVGNEGPLLLRDNSISADEQHPTQFELRIRETGEVFVNEREVGKMMVVTVDEPQALVKASATQFQLKDNDIYSPSTDENLQIRQGYIENSNVNIISEMVNMIQLQRSFELGQRVITTNDNTIDRSLEVGRFS